MLEKLKNLRNSVICVYLFIFCAFHCRSINAQNDKAEALKLLKLRSFPDYKPSWVTLDHYAQFECSAWLTNEGVLTWGLVSPDGVSVWTVDHQGKVEVVQKVPHHHTSFDGTGAVKAGGPWYSVYSPLLVRSTPRVDNTGVACLGYEASVDDIRDAINANRNDSQAQTGRIRVYYPPAFPRLVVDYHHPPATLYDRKTLRVSCFGYTGLKGKLIWTLATLKDRSLGGGVRHRQWTVDNSGHLRGDLPFGLQVIALSAKTDARKGPRVALTVRIVANLTMHGGSLTCATCRHPDFVKAGDLNPVCITSSNKTFVVKVVPMKPLVTSRTKIPPFKDLGQDHVETNCTAVVGGAGVLTWALVTNNTKIALWTVDSQGHASGLLTQTIGVKFSLKASLDKKDVNHGPRILSTLTLDMASVPQPALLACYSYNATSNKAFKGLRDSLCEISLLTGNDSHFKAVRLPNWAVVPATLAATMLVSMTLLSLTRRDGKTNLLELTDRAKRDTIDDGDNDEESETESNSESAEPVKA